MNVPFVDLKAQYQTIKTPIDTAIQEVINQTAFVGGQFPKAFENQFAKAYGVEHCIGVANGTDAIYIALKALGIGPGDEVITVANSWISTSETISQAGAKPVFVDIDTFSTIDPTKIEEKITAKTKAIIPVHLYGQPADIERIKEICTEHRLFLIEDCAQAHFARFDEQYVGTFGDIATFSFYPGKNLGAYGDAGAIITNNTQLAEKMRMYANHGALKKHHHQIEGINSRLDGIQAAVLLAKLPYIGQWNSRRAEVAKQYNQLLKNIPEIETPFCRSNVQHVYHLYVIRTRHRDALKQFLAEKEIGTAIHYPTALPLLPAYKYLNHSAKDFPLAAQYQNEILSLPLFPEITEQQIHYVAEQIKRFFE